MEDVLGDAVLTLVPVALAQTGYRFWFQGANQGDECNGCPFTKLCFGLGPGRRYEVTATRDVAHPCNLHDEGRVRVVEVQEIPFASTIERRLLRGTAAQWKAIDCGYPECDDWRLCHPPAPAGKKIIVEEGETVDCPMNFDIRRVQMRDS